MFSSLRNRLLLSYVGVIATVLFLVALALLVVSIASQVRLLPTLQQLAAISVSTRRELIRLREAGTTLPNLGRVLDETAAEQDVRAVVWQVDDRRVVYDSQSLGGWLGVSLAEVERLQMDLPNLAVGTFPGRLRGPDGSTWLVYVQEFNNRLVVALARPEPGPLAVFRQVFLTPLLRAGLAAFLLAVLLAAVISQSVARPLQEMARAAESIAQGDYDQQLAPQGPDEVRRLAGSFNTMATQVKRSQQTQRDFLANVSHDLKTPLTVIRGWSQALLDGTAASPAQQQQAAQVIHSEAERMARLVNQLLDLARLESGQLQLARQPLDLGPLLVELHDSLSLRAQEQGVQFDLDAPPTPAVLGDRDRLMQVFTNLVDNALTHTPAGGRVQVGLRANGRQAVEVMIQDTGRGIPPAELERIFERFYQVDKSRARREGQPGTGLGLAIARQLVEAHGGRLTAHSRPGEGSTFVVSLPIGV